MEPPFVGTTKTNRATPLNVKIRTKGAVAELLNDDSNVFEARVVSTVSYQVTDLHLLFFLKCSSSAHDGFVANDLPLRGIQRT
jgi:hypothetical protein